MRTGISGRCRPLTRPNRNTVTAIEKLLQFLFVPQHNFRRTMEHHIIKPINERSGVRLIPDAAFPLRIAVAKLETSALIRDTAIKEEQYRIAPVHMLTVELEQVLPLR